MLPSRGRIAKVATDVADHLQVPEQIRSLQEAQKELSQAIARIYDRLNDLSTDVKVLRAEVLLESVKQTQSVVNAVQGGLNQRIEDVAVRLAMAERDIADAIGPNAVEPGPKSRRSPKRIATGAS